MGEKMTAQVKLESGMRFDAASGSGHHVTLDASEQVVISRSGWMHRHGCYLNPAQETAAGYRL